MCNALAGGARHFEAVAPVSLRQWDAARARNHQGGPTGFASVFKTAPGGREEGRFVVGKVVDFGAVDMWEWIATQSTSLSVCL